MAIKNRGKRPEDEEKDDHRRRRRPQNEEEERKRREEDRVRIAKEYGLLFEDTFSPYKGLKLDRGDGKIQIEVSQGEEGKKREVKYRFFIVKKRKDDEHSRYFKDFDWRQKGLVRKRFEKVHRETLLPPDLDIKAFKEKIDKTRAAVKELEQITGKIKDMKKSLHDQYIKFDFACKPHDYYKEYFGVNNSDRRFSHEQIDVRRMPPYYAHRKIKEAIEDKKRELRKTKDNKMRLNLSDHFLFAIVTDGKRHGQDQKEDAKDENK